MRTMAILATIVLLTGCTADGPDPAPFEAELRVANAAYEKALLDGDAATLDRLLTTDFQIIDDDARLHSKRDQIDFITREVDLLEARGEDVRVTPLGADAALVTGRFIGRYRYQGREHDFTERYTSIWVRNGGEWQVRHEHASLVPVVPVEAS